MDAFRKTRSLLALLALLLFTLTGCESTRVIVHGLDERDANEIMVLLAKENIPAYKIQEKAAAGGGGPAVVLWDIAVSQEDAMQAMALLSVNGLPRTMSPNLIELFNAGGLVPSDMSEKIRYQAGLADSLANTIRKIDGVVDANVVLSFPEEDPLNPNAPKGAITASVFVKHTGILDDPNSFMIQKIRNLVSSAVSGLSYNNVTVIPDRARFSLPATTFTQAPPKEYIEVWKFVIAKSSLVYFQIFFFIASILLLVLFFSFALIFWKLHPILKKRGGLKELVRLEPLADSYNEPKAESTDEEKTEAEKEENQKEEVQKPKVQENIEE